MATLGDLTSELAELLADPLNAVWAPEDLEQYLRAGLRDLSAHLPRTRTTALECTAGEHALALPADFQAAQRVEYPAGEDPPVYIERGDSGTTAFWLAGERYDLLASEDGSATATLLLAASPAAGESVNLTYTADHDLAPEAADTLTVPDRWLNLLLLYGVWQAWLERVSAEEQNPDRSTEMLAQHAANAERARAAYEAALTRALATRAASQVTPAWRLEL